MHNKLLRIVFLILAGLLGVLALLAAVLMVVDGPVTAYRLLTRLDTTIYDYRYFPGRSLSASPVPFHFGVNLQEGVVPESILLKDGEAKPFDEVLESSKTIAFLVIQNDNILYERYLNGHSQESISQLFSTSKSILSILIGAAIQDGLIQSVEQPVTDYVPELAAAGFDQVTLENLLNMNSNMDYFENDNPFGEHVIFNFTDQLEKEILRLGLLETPDAQFRYKSGDNALLGLILKRALGEKTITQYLQERLWDPIGMEQDGTWGLDRADGLERTWCCLATSARDLAKFGRLFLRNGDWEGAQLLPADWVHISIGQGAYQGSQWPAGLIDQGAANYHYQWWLLTGEQGEYATWGKDGQYLYIHPGKGLMIIRLGESDGDLPWFLIFQEIARGIP